MVSALDSGACGPGSSPDRGHCVVFLDKILLSRCLSPPRCRNGTGNDSNNDNDNNNKNKVLAMTVTMTMTIITKTKYLSAHLKLLMRLQREVTTQFDIQGN